MYDEPSGMHSADIKALLAKAGASQADIARKVKGRHGNAVTPSAVSAVVLGLSKSAAIARQISRVTGVPVEQLWPNKYPAHAHQARQPRRTSRRSHAR